MSRIEEQSGYPARCGRQFETREQKFRHQKHCRDCMAEQLDEDRERRKIEQHQRDIRG